MIPWRIERAGRCLDAGIAAGTSKDVMASILTRRLGADVRIEDHAQYLVKAGGACASVWGDEFARVAEAHQIDESKLQPSGHLFAGQGIEIEIDFVWDMGAWRWSVKCPKYEVLSQYASFGFFLPLWEFEMLCRCGYRHTFKPTVHTAIGSPRRVKGILTP